MNANVEDISVASLASFAARIGLDWGDQEHAFQLEAPESRPVETGKIKPAPESLHAWLRQLGERFAGRPVALALEGNCGRLLAVFAQYPWLSVYPINPATSARYRKAFRLSGAKDDLPDAGVLLEILRLHFEKLTRWEPEDEATRRLDALCRARRDAVDRRTQVLNQLTTLLKGFYPQALELAGEDLSTAMALEFLGRWPELVALKAARPSTVQAFYFKHNVRRPELVASRLAKIKAAVALTTDPVVVEMGQMQMRLLLAQVRIFNQHIAQWEKQIRVCFQEHPEAELFVNLPGAGSALAPRLLVAFGTDRGRYPNAGSLQKYAGVAPVREKSGRQLWTHWRWQSPNFLRQSFVEWAGQTVVWSAWARCYYQRMVAAGKTHHVILRALAFKWIRVLWKCWQTRIPYDESTYLKALAARQSPNLPQLKPA
jgi:transposase